MSDEKNPAVAGQVERRVMHSRDLGFTIVAVAHRHRVDFTIYDVEGWAEGETKGEYDRPVWHRAGAHSHPDAVDTLEEAEPYLHGEVTWDGCSNWHFDEQDRVMLHGCCKADVQRFGDVMALCWDLAAEMCPAWNA
jgi:hypothetical protein